MSVANVALIGLGLIVALLCIAIVWRLVGRRRKLRADDVIDAGLDVVEAIGEAIADTGDAAIEIAGEAISSGDIGV